MRVAELAHRLDQEEKGQDAEVGASGVRGGGVGAGGKPQGGSEETEREEEDEFPLGGVELARQLVAAERLDEVDEDGVVVRDVPDARGGGEEEHGEVPEETENLDVDAGADGSHVGVPEPAHGGEVGGNARDSAAAASGEDAARKRRGTTSKANSVSRARRGTPHPYLRARSVVKYPLIVRERRGFARRFRCDRDETRAGWREKHVPRFP